MEKIYLVIIDFFENEENSIVNICSNFETAERLMKEYKNNCEKYPDNTYMYHIDEVLLTGEDILWDCYINNQIEV